MPRPLKHCSNCQVPISQELRDAYSVPDVRLRGILLSPRGVVMNAGAPGDGVTALHMCPPCRLALSKNKLPECAIANGLAIGMHRDHGPTFEVDHPINGRQTMRWCDVRTAEFSGMPRRCRPALSVRLSLTTPVSCSMLHRAHHWFSRNVHWRKEPCVAGQHRRRGEPRVRHSNGFATSWRGSSWYGTAAFSATACCLLTAGAYSTVHFVGAMTSEQTALLTRSYSLRTWVLRGILRWLKRVRCMLFHIGCASLSATVPGDRTTHSTPT